MFVIVLSILGILAGAWPCGIIMLVSELFRSESKSQVYASLHQFFDDYPSVLDNLSKSFRSTVRFVYESCEGSDVP